MRTKLCTTLLFFFAFSIIHAQMDVQTEFETFAKKQNELFMKAYESRDVNTYQIVLGDFFVQFNKLGSADKKSFPLTSKMPFIIYAVPIPCLLINRGHLLLEDATQIPVSRNKKEFVKKELGEFF